MSRPEASALTWLGSLCWKQVMDGSGTQDRQLLFIARAIEHTRQPAAWSCMASGAGMHAARGRAGRRWVKRRAPELDGVAGQK